MQLPQGWIPVSGELASKLEAELRRELPTAHQLHDRAIRAVARREGRDDVLFKSIDDATIFCVHLTWSVETDAKWPWTETYRDHDDFLERWPREELEEGAG
jgi:hypothetical protein